jgi:hypothetical protein
VRWHQQQLECTGIRQQLHARALASAAAGLRWRQAAAGVRKHQQQLGCAGIIAAAVDRFIAEVLLLWSFLMSHLWCCAACCGCATEKQAAMHYKLYHDLRLDMLPLPAVSMPRVQTTTGQCACQCCCWQQWQQLLWRLLLLKTRLLLPLAKQLRNYS